MAGAASLAERKRIELGKALATRPRLVLLDEMFEGLSEDEITDMVSLLRGLHSEGISFIFIEHVMRALRSLADNLMVIDKGVLIASGPTVDVLQDPAVRRAYLGMGPVDGVEPAGPAPADTENNKATDSARQEELPGSTVAEE
jgi:branched-chain amino acid transport system ATP-binding protein